MDPLDTANEWDEPKRRVLATVADELKRVIGPPLLGPGAMDPDSSEPYLPEADLGYCLGLYERACEEGGEVAMAEELEQAVIMLAVVDYATAAAVLRLVASGYTLAPPPEE